MRLLHPRTLEIAAERDDIPKTVISHVWSEIFKWKASGKSHPKMFIENPHDLGSYLWFVYFFGKQKECKLDKNKVQKLGTKVLNGFTNGNPNDFDYAFDDNYLFSDACSLYYKGINIFPDIFGDDWRKYVPVESREEIMRQCQKTLNK